MLLAADSPAAISASMGLGGIGFAQVYDRVRPDLLLVLGDRFRDACCRGWRLCRFAFLSLMFTAAKSLRGPLTTHCGTRSRSIRICILHPLRVMRGELCSWVRNRGV
jgi:hypothetical protein